jgi:uncharacterized protein YlzI (FlbEa/FlbD family)
MFIGLTDLRGRVMLVNLDAVTRVISSVPHTIICLEKENIEVQESYEEVLLLIPHA